jgi:hypothetical protein
MIKKVSKMKIFVAKCRKISQNFTKLDFSDALKFQYVSSL